MTGPRVSVDMIGYVAATMTTISFVPQLLRVVKLRSARDVSLGMFLIFSTGTMCWLMYGLKVHSAPVWIANAVTLVLSLAILILKIYYDRQPVAEVVSVEVGMMRPLEGKESV